MTIEPSTLYVVATPIGNLQDLTPRAIEVLSGVDFIAAEDTRVTKKLLSNLGIRKSLISCYRENEHHRAEEIVGRLMSGESCALCSDAGTPAVSDPGQQLVNRCVSEGITVVPIPGCSALVTAISASGMNCGRFCFEGFLPIAKNNRKQHLEDIREERRPMIFYEAPHKLKATLRDLLNTLGDREICIAREMTKIHEEFIRTTLSEAYESLKETEPRGEYVLIVAGAEIKSKEPDRNEAVKIALKYRSEGASLSEACKRAAQETGVPRSEIYRMCCGDE